MSLFQQRRSSQSAHITERNGEQGGLHAFHFAMAENNRNAMLLELTDLVRRGRWNCGGDQRDSRNMFINQLQNRIPLGVNFVLGTADKNLVLG